MTSRCVKCNASHFFRQTRGAKLSEQRCQCGGRFELIVGAPSLDCSNLTLPDDIVPEIIGGKPWLFPSKNRAGQLFIYIKATNSYKPLNL